MHLHCCLFDSVRSALMRKVAKTGAFCVFLSYKSLVDKCQTRYDTANNWITSDSNFWLIIPWGIVWSCACHSFSSVRHKKKLVPFFLSFTLRRSLRTQVPDLNGNCYTVFPFRCYFCELVNHKRVQRYSRAPCVITFYSVLENATCGSPP